MNNALDEKAIKSLRVLALEMIDKAKSGHPGMALDIAPLLYVLYTEYMHIAPKLPHWMNRDRFVLGAGHASSILYATLMACGYDITLDDLKNFRQLKSRTPGHPEYARTAGVDMTSGPLGQGIAEGCGLQIANSYLHHYFGDIINHKTYVIVGDGDMQEGITQEALSLAGHLQIDGLVVLYDANAVQLDGYVKDTNTESIKDKVQAMNWTYLYVNDGNDLDEIRASLDQAQKISGPVFIEYHNIIGIGTTLQGTNKCHGAPIPHEETVALRAQLGGEAFTIDPEVLAYIRSKINLNDVEVWYDRVHDFKSDSRYTTLVNMLENRHLVDFKSIKFDSQYDKATRYAFGQIFSEISKQDPFFIGGAADLASSTQGKIEGGIYTKDNPAGRNILFGVREDAMGAIVNGIAVHGGLKGFMSGFFVFSDYLKPALRISALMQIPTIGLFSHDSIAVGEDGPSHQPIEQLTMLRSTPNVNVIRPCDCFEALQAFEIAYTSGQTPTMLIASRQVTRPVSEGICDVKKGAYILSKEKGALDGILIASGTEVALALDAQAELEKEGIFTRVVSMPSMYLFDQQWKGYQEEVLPKSCRKRIGIEMSDGSYFAKYVGLDGAIVSMNSFGLSGPFKDVMKAFGFTKEHIVKTYKKLSQTDGKEAK